MAETSGISVCFGNVQDKALLEDAKLALEAMKAKWSEKIQIDTTHFVCTTPASESASGQSRDGAGPGVEYQRALQLSIPVVQPQWILACHAQKKYVYVHSLEHLNNELILYTHRMVPIAGFYLGVTPNTAPAFQRPQSMSQVNLQKSSARAAASTSPTVSNRASMPPPRRSTASDADTSTFVGQTPEAPARKGNAGPTRIEEEAVDEGETEGRTSSGSGSRMSAAARRARNGTMDRNFRFPSPTGDEPPPPLPTSDSVVSSTKTPEVPPPDPVEKEKERVVVHDDEDVGETEEISLN